MLLGSLQKPEKEAEPREYKKSRQSTPREEKEKESGVGSQQLAEIQNILGKYRENIDKIKEQLLNVQEVKLRLATY